MKNIIEYNHPIFKDYTLTERYGKYGFLNKDEKVVITCQYENYGFTHNEFANMKLNGKWGIINYAGKEIVPFIYDMIEKPRYEYINIVQVMRNGFWGFVDFYCGKEFIPCVYQKVNDFINNYAIVWRNSKCGIVNKNGEEVVLCKYDRIEHHYDYFITKLNNKYGISLPSNEIVACVFDEICRIKDLLCFRSATKWGVIHVSKLASLKD